MTNSLIAEQLGQLPTSPGVYLLKDAEGNEVDKVPGGGHGPARSGQGGFPRIGVLVVAGVIALFLAILLPLLVQTGLCL